MPISTFLLACAQYADGAICGLSQKASRLLGASKFQMFSSEIHFFLSLEFYSQNFSVRMLNKEWNLQSSHHLAPTKGYGSFGICVGVPNRFAKSWSAFAARLVMCEAFIKRCDCQSLFRLLSQQGL